MNSRGSEHNNKTYPGTQEQKKKRQKDMCTESQTQDLMGRKADRKLTS